jgi:hypothetical protein
MTFLRLMALTFALAILGAAGFAQQQNASAETPTADAIMARVAVNQDRTEAERGHYVYVQHARVVSRKGSKVMCEEVTDYRVTPSASGSHRELIKLDGRMLVKHKYVTYTSLLLANGAEKTVVENDHDSISVQMGDENTDRSLVENMRKNLTDDKSKDGINAQLFPMTTKGQVDTLFYLVGRERINGRDVFHIDFRPKDKNDFGWKGDAYIDVDAYQPVLIRTDMARKIPLAVRALLGTNLPGLGFSVVYAPQPDGVWLPTSFGTEFKIHVLFFFSRQIIIDAQNRDFEKTHVSSKIVGAVDGAQPDQPWREAGYSDRTMEAAMLSTGTILRSGESRAGS